MAEQKMHAKVKNMIDTIKQTAVEYTHFLKQKLKLYEITRQYNTSVYELGHRFYTTTKSGGEDIKIFSPAIERVKELEYKLMSLRESLNKSADEKSTDNGKNQ